MNAGIAELLKARIAAFSFVDKLAGLVRPITYERAGGTMTIPVGIDVVDALTCDESTQLALVPNDAYRAIVYFEDKGGLTRENVRGRTVWTSHLRLICWVNTARLGGDNSAGDRVMQEFVSSLNVNPYSDGPYIAVRHRVEAIPAKGPSLFSAYTYPEGVRQYLMPPFDAFGIDIATVYRLDPSCGDVLDPTNVSCWIPPTTHRRRNPNEFTCEELTDPVTGLTTEQLGVSCLNCAGSGPCDPATVTINGTEVATPASGGTANLVVEDQDGNPVGSWDGSAWVVTIPEPMILPYADKATAQADTLTIPTTAQLVRIIDTNRAYFGAPPASVADLVNAEDKYLLPVTEVVKDLQTVVGGDTVLIQLIA